ncbi:MAG: hypothetical protein ACYC5O_06265 [Anaerolineae bacterium]
MKIDDCTCNWSDVHMGKCTLSYYGADSTMSPFTHRSLPGWSLDVSQQDMPEDAGAHPSLRPPR